MDTTDPMDSEHGEPLEQVEQEQVEQATSSEPTAAMQDASITAVSTSTLSPALSVRSRNLRARRPGWTRRAVVLVAISVVLLTASGLTFLQRGAVSASHATASVPTATATALATDTATSTATATATKKPTATATLPPVKYQPPKVVKGGGSTPPPTPPPSQGVPPGPDPAGGVPPIGGQLVLVNLAQQWLWVYQNGTLVYDTPVTTGMPQLATPTGRFDIEWRETNITFISPWPPGSPYYYTPEHINYAMYFADDGYYIHDAPWRHCFGPGTNVPHTCPDGTQDTGSHGCVNVPTPAGAWLYTHTHDGATVDIVNTTGQDATLTPTPSPTSTDLPTPTDTDTPTATPTDTPNA